MFRDNSNKFYRLQKDIKKCFHIAGFEPVASNVDLDRWNDALPLAGNIYINTCFVMHTFFVYLM